MICNREKSGVVVFLVAEDGVGTVKLLKEEEAHHLMVESQLRE